ncbi:CarD family transcriptional regulator [uncultured Desulfovibrio sp.]|uniref:CarD family transcriptional regulator n=1 Tax=uncultured Desulfovibrio sp. TaxID=167968 RepID=UPI0028063E60|nr:CarD family transcriptional regulator [uncultured Desulfovibrio sp.]
MFAPDNLVVYPAQGVGRIERIDHKDIGGVACEFYIVRIRANNITLMVPVHNAVNVGLRRLITRKEANRILDVLRSDRERTVFTGQNWNRRFREYSERLKSPDLAVVADVLRELLLIGRNKELSFGERRLLEQAMSLVGGELAEVLGLSQDELREELLALYAAAQAAAEAQCKSA